jgi:uncharacterized protein YjiS (DUF1127 family)
MGEIFKRQFVYWREYRKLLKELSCMTDRELNDIGIRFADIKNIAAEYAHKKMLGL